MGDREPAGRGRQITRGVYDELKIQNVTHKIVCLFVVRICVYVC